MSVEAMTWAFRQSVSHSSAKFVLVAIANCASADTMEAYPSVAHLSEATGQNRKTVIENLKRLKAWGYIEDCGTRKGVTGQVVVYRLKRPENGTVKESQKRNSTENGTVPKTDRKSPKNGREESLFFPKESLKRDTEPSEPSGTVRATRKKAPASAVARPPEVPEQTWADWLALRKAKRAPVTETVVKQARTEAGKAGMPLERFLEVWCARGSQGLQADWLKPHERAGPAPNGRPGAAASFHGKTYKGTLLDDIPEDLRPRES